MSESDHGTFDLDRLKIDRKLNETSSTRWKSLWVVFFLLVVAAAGWFFWSRQNVQSVEITEILLRSATQQSSVLNASGYVTPRRRATVAAKITGRVSALYIDEGMAVSEGQVLAGIDASDIQRELDSARADLAVANAGIADFTVNREDAQRKLKRQQALFDQALISRQDLETAQTTVDSLDARIALAKKQVEAAKTRVLAQEQNLDNYTIRAPFSGIVVSKDAQIGEMVSPISAGGGYTRTGIATIVDMDSLEIEVDINESHIARVTVGQRVEATLDAYPDWKLPAKVRTVIPTADRQKATVKVRITFDSLDPKILPDMGIKVAFLEEKKEETVSDLPTLEVKSSAVIAKDDRSYVYVYASGTVERREIKTGAVSGDMTEILSGLSAGDQLVDQPPADLSDGAKVTVNKKGNS